jgi:hypothetical protein
MGPDRITKLDIESETRVRLLESMLRGGAAVAASSWAVAHYTDDLVKYVLSGELPDPPPAVIPPEGRVKN